MRPISGTLLFATRATSLLAAACQLAGGREVLLPALYCPDVADSIETAGIRVRCYDWPADLSCPDREILTAMNDDVGAIIVMHPFGLARPIRHTQPHHGLIVIEDACHALRTAFLRDDVGRGDLVVYSPRKELGWPEGGVVTGPSLARMAGVFPPCPTVASRWQTSDLATEACKGRQATELAIAALGNLLPPVRYGEVLTALPVKSRERDATIDRLRAAGVEAWRWLGTIRGSSSSLTPGAWELREQLVLIPTLDLERTLHLLLKEPLEPWMT